MHSSITKIKQVARALKTRLSNFLSWLKSSRKHQLITAAAAIVLLSSGVVLAATLNNTDQPIDPGSMQASVEQSIQAKTLRIESNIPGIAMAGSSFCDSSQLRKVTPYDCEFKKEQTETVITAPAETNINNELFVFLTWDGCSADNPDKRICKVDLKKTDTKIIKANYEKSTSKPVSSKKQSQTTPSVANPQTPDEYMSYSASGCPAAPDNLQNHFKMYGSQVFCLVDLDIPAGSKLIFTNFKILPSSSDLFSLDTTTVFGTCYIEQRIASDACVRAGTNQHASQGYPLNIQRGNTLEVMQSSTLVISSTYKTQSYSSGVSRTPTNKYYIFDSWEITKSVNNDGTFNYSVVTIRKTAQ